MNRSLISSNVSKVFALAATVGGLSLPARDKTHAQSIPSEPSVSYTVPGDYRLYVRERNPDGTLGAPLPAALKGVCWSPTSIGSDPTADSSVYKEQFNNWVSIDLPLIAAMNCNAVRVYYDFGPASNGLPILDAMYSLGLKVVIAADWQHYGSIASLSNLTNVVNTYKNHPAVLGFNIGNEWDLPNGPNGTYYYGAFSNLTDSANFIQAAAGAIKALDTNHAVFTFIADPHIPGIHSLSAQLFPYEPSPLYTDQIVNTICSNVDVWGLNVYRGNSFQDLFFQWRSITPKPMMIGEFGADAYNHAISGVDETMQAKFDERLWDEAFYDFSATRTNGSCVGIFKFEWQDQWEKNGEPGVQNISYERNPGQPDDYNDEEYFGVTDINRVRRLDYYGLQSRYGGGAAVTLLESGPTLAAYSSCSSSGQGTVAQFQIDEKTMFSRAGGEFGARGINVAVLDQNTGIRLSGIKSFDTWVNQGNFDALVSYVQSLPVGSIVSFAACDNAGVGSAAVYNSASLNNGIRYLQNLGSAQIANVGPAGSWAMIVKKGLGVLAEGESSSAPVSISSEVTVQNNPNAGAYPSQIIVAPSPQNNWNMTIEDGATSRRYKIQTGSDVTNFSTIATIPVDPSGYTVWSDPEAPASTRFYRVERQ